jgi:hypothetical protein
VKIYTIIIFNLYSNYDSIILIYRGGDDMQGIVITAYDFFKYNKKDFEVDEIFYLEKDDTHVRDPHAIKVMDWSGEKVGYVSNQVNQDVYPLLNEMNPIVIRENKDQVTADMISDEEAAVLLSRKDTYEVVGCSCETDECVKLNQLLYLEKTSTNTFNPHEISVYNLSDQIIGKVKFTDLKYLYPNIKVRVYAQVIDEKRYLIRLIESFEDEL